MLLDRIKYELIGTAEYLSETVYIARNADNPQQLFVYSENDWRAKTESKLDIEENTLIAIVNNQSPPEDKVAFFIDLFGFRNDLYAKRWENKAGHFGYSPVCKNEWSAVCPKACGEKIKCNVCSHRDFEAMTAEAIDNHLRGKITVGVYPMSDDETCRFLAIDFDDADFKKDALSVAKICKIHGIEYGIERSRSGRGVHLWIFFNEPVTAYLARKLGSALITHAMSDNHSLKFDSYDRMFPNQDTMPKGGFGNLIALPLQKHPRQNDNSVFVDNDFNVISDQWSFLSSIKRYAAYDVEELIRLICPLDELGMLKKDMENEQPWEKKKQIIDLSSESFPDSVIIVKANMIYIDKTGLSDKILNHIKRFAAFKNPEFYKAQAMRMPVFNKPRIISISEETDKYLCMPRGLEEEIKAFFEGNNVKIKVENKYNTGSKIKVEFNGTLRDEQQKAADALLANSNGILAATTAFGKTVVGAYLIGKRKRNTLILVHRTQLMTQWKEKLSEFLNIDEELPTQPTKRGRKKKSSIIGQLGGGKNDTHGVIDIAVIQSLFSGDDVKDLVKDYGMVIVDECHHISAFSFEKVLKEVNAKYVYGLTATPTRQDGHHPIIYMQCGNIRYSVNAKEQAEKRPFEHYIIPKFTRLNIEDSDSKSITEIYKYISESEMRNEQIINDVITGVKNGKNPVILTERTFHVEYLAKKLSEADLPNVIPLTGGLTAKKSRELLEHVRNIPEDENFVLVATGKYIGEGFDMPRLDTLFLAMPISWKGTLQQYAGRLHRLCDNKTEVIIYDYVDIRVPVLEKMYQKRLKGYASIGYKAKGETTAIDDINIIFNTSNFLSVYANDIAAAQKGIIIVSPFLTKRRINIMLKTLINTSAKITVITRPCDDYKENDMRRINECIEILEMNNITVKTKSKIHQKYSLIDNRIVWYGSINLLSFGTAEESIMRIESENIANELLGIII